MCAGAWWGLWPGRGAPWKPPASYTLSVFVFVSERAKGRVCAGTWWGLWPEQQTNSRGLLDLGATQLPLSQSIKAVEGAGAGL